MIAAPLQTPLTALLGCRYPVLQAGMGGVARAELAVAVSAAGGYGFLGMVRESAALISREINEVRQRTDQAFGVNLIPAATDPVLLDEELAVCFEAGVHSLCLFWDVVPEVIARAHAAGCLVLHQVGSVADAVAAAEAGADAIIAQGVEAGGHVRGTLSSLVLLPQVVAAVDVPVVACGGFASGASLVAALALGAAGMHCGTVFLATQESFAHAYHKQRLVEASSENTVYTDIFGINWPPGAPVRVLANSVTEAHQDHLLGHDPQVLPRETVATDDGRPVYRYSTDSPLRTTEGALELLPAYAGQVAGQVHRIAPAGELLASIMRDAEASLTRLKNSANSE